MKMAIDPDKSGISIIHIVYRTVLSRSGFVTHAPRKFPFSFRRCSRSNYSFGRLYNFARHTHHKQVDGGRRRCVFCALQQN